VSASRRRFLGALAAGAAVACASPRAVRAAGTIRVGAVASDVSGEPFYAEKQGFFRNAGLTVTTTAFTNGGTIIGAVASNALDVGFSNLTSVAAARQRGLPIKIVSPATLYTSKAPVTVLVKARGSKLRTGADLRGKTVAVSTLRGELHVAVQLWIDTHGGDAKQTQFLEVPFATMAQALTSGRIDAAMMTEPGLTQHKDEVELLSDAYTAIAPEFLIGAFVASDSWLRDNADDARKFASAMAQTAAWANGHHAETAPMLAERTGIDVRIVQEMTRATYGERLVADQIQPVLDAAHKYGSLKDPMRARDLI
jgi:NitT/TauT family transport system substrate-binding protein